MTEASTKITQLTTRVTTLEDKDVTNDGVFQSIETQVADQKNELAQLHNQVQDCITKGLGNQVIEPIESKVTKVEGQLGDLQQKITDIVTAINGIKSSGAIQSEGNSNNFTYKQGHHGVQSN